jgi:hypothetical protein
MLVAVVVVADGVPGAVGAAVSGHRTVEAFIDVRAEVLPAAS